MLVFFVERKSMMNDQLKPVRFQYTRDAGYRVVLANGAWLSASTNGMIARNLIVEPLANPTDRISTFEGEKWLSESPVAEPEEILALREAQIGILVNPATARTIAYLLLAKRKILPRLPLRMEKTRNKRADLVTDRKADGYRLTSGMKQSAQTAQDRNAPLK